MIIFYALPICSAPPHTLMQKVQYSSTFNIQAVKLIDIDMVGFLTKVNTSQYLLYSVTIGIELPNYGHKDLCLGHHLGWLQVLIHHLGSRTHHSTWRCTNGVGV